MTAAVKYVKFQDNAIQKYIEKMTDESSMRLLTIQKIEDIKKEAENDKDPEAYNKVITFLFDRGFVPCPFCFKVMMRYPISNFCPECQNQLHSEEFLQEIGLRPTS